MNIRQKIIEVSYKAHACHIGSALSCVEILEAIDDVRIPEEDSEFIFSKASGVGAYYCMRFDTNKAIELLREHPLPSKEGGLVWSGGSLGQGLSVACGIALTGKLVYVLLSDGELQEGQTWEALMFAAHHGLPLKVVVDRNGLQALGSTESISSLEPLQAKFKAFGWNTKVCDGHNVRKLKKALRGRTPLVVIAKTIKGKGCKFIENMGYKNHYYNLDEKGYSEAILSMDSEKGS